MKNYSTLTIAVEAKALAALRTGIGQYVFGLYTAIAEKSNPPTANYFVNQAFTRHLPAAAEHKLPNTPQWATNLAKRLKGWDNPLAYPKKIIATKSYHWRFNRHLKKLNADVVHCTDFFCTGNQSGIPEFITVYDLSCFRCPETHPTARVRLFNRLLPASLEKSRHILTISEFSKNELVSYFGVDPDKITVTYCGLSPQFKAIPAQNSPEMLNLYGLADKRYFLYVGTIEPRKNLGVLLEAYQALPDPIKQHYPLVIVGALGWKFEHFMQKAHSLLQKRQLVMPGYVPEQHLPQLMAGAFCFLYPSVYEGFGIPPLEAMASRTPVVVSNRASLPEVVGQAGILLPPDDALSWRDAMASLVDDPNRYRHYVEQGLRQSALFTWEACADRTLACFQKYK